MKKLIKDKLTNEKWLGFTLEILKYYIIVTIIAIITCVITLLFTRDTIIISVVLSGGVTAIVTCIVEGKTKYEKLTSKITTVQCKLYYYLTELVNNSIANPKGISNKANIINDTYDIIKDLHKYLVFDSDKEIILCTSDISRINYLIKMLISYLSDLEAIKINLDNEDLMIKLYRTYFTLNGIEEIKVNKQYKNELNIAKNYYIKNMVNIDLKLGMIIYALNEIAVSTLEYEANIENMEIYSQYLNSIIDIDKDLDLDK